MAAAIEKQQQSEVFKMAFERTDQY